MFEMHDRAVEAVLEFLFQLVVIADGVSVFNPADAPDDTRVVKDVLDESGFPGSGAAGYCNVADIRRGVFGHERHLRQSGQQPPFRGSVAVWLRLLQFKMIS